MSNEKKKVLLVGGGITENLYFRRDLESNIHLLASLYKKYDYIHEINTNELRDKFTPQFIDNQAWTDVIKLYLNPFKKRAIKHLIEKTVERFQANGYEVDIVGHSLFTVELAFCDVKVNEIIFLGSPLGMRFPCGAFCRNKLAPIPFTKPKLECKHFYNFYSPNDIVGTHTILGDYRTHFGSVSNVEINTGTVHDLPKYLENAEVISTLIL